MGVAMSSSAPFSPSTLVADYVSQLSEYEALRSAAVAHMARLLQEAGLNIHHVTARLKKPASLPTNCGARWGATTRSAT